MSSRGQVTVNYFILYILLQLTYKT